MSSDISTEQVVDWTDLGREMWSFLTGREAAINYRFIDMAVEVPRDTGPEAPRATWKLNGTLQITTKDNLDRAAPEPCPPISRSTPTWSSPSTSPAPAPSAAR